MNIPKNIDYAGYSDWRVPTKDELKSLVYCSSGKTKNFSDGIPVCDGDYQRPTIVQMAFPNTLSYRFWSSSLYVDYSNHAWAVYFDLGYGYYDDKGGNGVIRLVRSGQ